MKRIVLASASDRRKQLLKQVGIEFTVCPSKGKEITTRTRADEVVKELSYQKAREVFNKGNQDAIVIGADTIVYFEDHILGKPVNKEQWKEMLKSIQGRSHYVFTGVCVIWKSDDGNTHVLSFEEMTRVELHEISDSEIDEYIASGEAADKAGGYGIQGSFAKFVAGISGDYNNVVGLPVSRLYQEFKKMDLI